MYTDEARHELDLLSNTWLVDEFQQSLKSMGDYREAVNHITEASASLKVYMEKNLLFLAGDWPTWYYNKKIICQVGLKLQHHSTSYSLLHTQKRTVSKHTFGIIHLEL